MGMITPPWMLERKSERGQGCESGRDWRGRERGTIKSSHCDPDCYHQAGSRTLLPNVGTRIKPLASCLRPKEKQLTAEETREALFSLSLQAEIKLQMSDNDSYRRELLNKHNEVEDR